MGVFSHKRRRRRRLDAALRTYEPGKDDEADQDEWEMVAELLPPPPQDEKETFGSSVALSSVSVLVGGSRVWEFGIDGTYVKQWNEPGKVAASGNSSAICLKNRTISADELEISRGDCFDVEVSQRHAIVSTRSENAVYVDDRLILESFENASVAIDDDEILVGGDGLALLRATGSNDDWTSLTGEAGDEGFGRLVAHRGSVSIIAGNDAVYVYDRGALTTTVRIEALSMSLEDNTAAVSSTNQVTVYNSKWEETARILVEGAEDVDLFGRDAMVVGSPSRSAAYLFQRKNSGSSASKSSGNGFDIVTLGVIPVVFTLLALTCAISLLRLMRVPGLFFKRKFTPCAECRMIDGTYEENIPHTHVVEVIELTDVDEARRRCRLPTATSLPVAESSPSSPSSSSSSSSA